MRFDLTGKWYNQHGSEMQIEASPDGCLSGSFRSGVGCPEPGETFDLVGFVSDSLIGFTVRFSRYDSITSWTGHCGLDEGRETIYALWHMSVGVPGPEHADQLWEGIWSGADTFLRESAATVVSRPRRASHPTASGPRSGSRPPGIAPRGVTG